MRFVFRQENWDGYEDEMYWYLKAAAKMFRKKTGHAAIPIRRILMLYLGLITLIPNIIYLVRYGSGDLSSRLLLTGMLFIGAVLTGYGLFFDRWYARRLTRKRMKSGAGNAEFTFEENSFLLHEDEHEATQYYSSVSYVLRHGDYLYLQVEPRAVVGVNLQTIAEGTADGFIEFLKQKCGTIEEF